MERQVNNQGRSGLLLANQFGVSLLYEDIQRDLGVSGRGWAIRPFSGSDARVDGLAAIGYDLDELPASRARPDAYAPEYLGVSYEPPLGIGIMRLVVEIDSGSEGAGRQVPPFDRSSAARFVVSCSNLEREPYSPMILLSHNC